MGQVIELRLTAFNRRAVAVGDVFRVGKSFKDDSLAITADWPIPTFILMFVNDCWRLSVSDARGAPPLRLNGIEVSEAFLRPGDLLEPTPGVRVRFRA